ncbi:hypothetical protein EDD27_10244 [Nonomuraea polychroma]|uniref:Outer membrane lipoprotein-sorting protein n=1 Tax=Nonomuraea polychroma TaxID=46176 RepID=A0A438MNC9_9ACTN|nr:hypothetical protein [Nonomuraea polychroma]RVX47314.1 hypothetical protein EDD27_10244 [Nonomuraea polychroma]
MKRMIAGAVVAAMAVLMAATPAEASDPLAALKSKLRAGKGVTFTEATSHVDDTGTTTFLKRTGKMQFGKSGIVASDITADFKRYQGGIFDHMYRLRSGRTIWVGGKTYSTAPMLHEVPEGKKWVREPLGTTGGWLGTFAQVVNPAEPATLKVLLKGKKQGRTYSGKITYSALAKVSPWFRVSSPFSEKEKTVIEYKLTLGADNLPKKLVTSHLASSHVAEGVEVGDGKFSTETRYERWGARVSISAPPKSQVAS